MIPWLMAGAGASEIGGNIFGSLFGASAEKRRANSIYNAGVKGADDILNYTNKANATAEKYGTLARSELSPFRDIGMRAGTSLADMLMGGGDVAAMLKASPLFNFQSELGSRNINRELSARGLYGSGAGLETLAKFNDQLVGEEGQRMVDRLFSLTGLGVNAASDMSRGDLSTGSLLSMNTLNGGTAAARMRYNATVGAADATAAADNTLASMGQNIFNTVGKGLQAFGSYTMNQPLIDSSIRLNDSLAAKWGGSGYGMTNDDYPG